MLHICKTSELTLRTIAARVSSRLYAKDYASSSDDEKQPKKQKRIEEQHDNAKEKDQKEGGEESAVTRLNRLLGSMQTDTNSALAKQSVMARPGEANKKRKEAAKQKVTDEDIVAAAERVASLLGENNKKQTESELLSKLLGHSKSDTGAKKGEDAPTGQEGDLSLSELIVGMKIDRRQQPQEQTRSEYVHRSIASKTYQQNHHQQKYQNLGGSRTPQQRKEFKREAETYTGSVNLFNSEPLGIFNNPEELRQVPDILGTWSHLQQRELKMQISHPPSNYFEKMALWTEQGKVWRFPIDNEQDMNEEADVDFSEHIFLEQHLEPWCPTKGPIRHFMELVCVGLSKNPYISATDKKEHILWYRDYFEAKKDILKDLMNKEKMNEISAGEIKLES